ncbi:MAG: ATP-binding protein [Spirochaetes bacterium]|nr:ATP-binding protein [Spirochaetota bacterium]NMB63593.1 ATP-binding protein [Spirochaetota bacterium]
MSYSNNNNDVKKYIDSYNATSQTVPMVIDRLLTDLNEMQYPKEEIEEIILSMDEALTNAIQETIRKEHNLNISYDPEMREITVMYIVSKDEFEAVIIDHGKGFNFNESIKKTPDKTSFDYFEQITRYSSEKESGLHIRVNGQQISLKGIGAGLKIICAFMDSINIDLIDKEKIVSDTVSPLTDGTILTMRRKRRY